MKNNFILINTYHKITNNFEGLCLIAFTQCNLEHISKAITGSTVSDLHIECTICKNVSFNFVVWVIWVRLKLCSYRAVLFTQDVNQKESQNKMVSE